MRSHRVDRRGFLRQLAALSSTAALAPSLLRPAHAQTAGQRPPAHPGHVRVLNPQGRVPVSLIIDDSTCLVNTNKFAIPQFAAAWGPGSSYEKYPWQEWPNEIPDSFVREFGEWSASAGLKGKYSIVPYPACVGRLDRELPGWTARQLRESIDLVRTVLTPNWDIHPEMVTHTRIIDLKTGHPIPERNLKFMENWEWTTGRSAAEIADYMAYALRILKEIGLPCEGITTPGGFGNRALPQLSEASLLALSDVYNTEVPHYFRHLYDKGSESVAPRVEQARDLDGPHPRCVVSIIGCTGDWTGGWDNTEPAGVDKFITPDLQSGRLVEIIQRGEPACMLAHWTGVYHNGRALGFNIIKEAWRRVQARFTGITSMKLSEIARYWAARELTRIQATPTGLAFHAPFACPAFTLRIEQPAPQPRPPRLVIASNPESDTPALRETQGPLMPGTWSRQPKAIELCFNLPKGPSTLQL